MDLSATSMVRAVAEGAASPLILTLLLLAVIGLAIVAVNRQLAVRQLRDSDRALRDLYDNIGEGVFRSTLDGRMISANPYLVRLNGFASEEEMLREVNDIGGRWYVDPNRRAELHALLLKSGSVSGVVSEVYRYRTRERIWIEETTRLVRDPITHRPLYYDGTIREVTEKVLRHDLQKRYDQIGGTAFGCVYLHRRAPDGKRSMPYASPAISELFGVTPDELVVDASILMRRIHPDDQERVVTSLDKSQEALEPWQCDYRVTVPGRPERWISAHAFPERDVDGSTLWHGFLMDVTDRKRAEERIYRLAFFDPLTGLPNRARLLDLLNELHQQKADRGLWNALLFLDLDQFKLLNDSKGHLAGDRLLVEVADRLRSCSDQAALVGRYGGDEFVILLRQVAASRGGAEAKVRVFAGLLLNRLAEAFDVDGSKFETTASIGVSLFGGGERSVDEVLKQADLAMYDAKEAGGGRVRFFEPAMQAEIDERLTLRRELREALTKGELLLLYQPQVDDDLRCLGAEALLRWRHPVRGEIKPGIFLALAEPFALAPMIDAFVLRTACATLRAWRGNPQTSGLNLSVNITANQLSRPEFIATVADALGEAGVDPALLTLELTEHVMLDDVVAVSGAMARLKAMGVKLALDDFGTGYSSLTYLRQLPLDILKIDRSFIREIETNPGDRAIVKTILDFAASLELAVVAEGVETEHQLRVLRQLGCRAFQGFLFARPMSKEDFAAFALADPRIRQRNIVARA